MQLSRIRMDRSLAGPVALIVCLGVSCDPGYSEAARWSVSQVAEQVEVEAAAMKPTLSLVVDAMDPNIESPIAVEPSMFDKRREGFPKHFTIETSDAALIRDAVRSLSAVQFRTVEGETSLDVRFRVIVKDADHELLRLYASATGSSIFVGKVYEPIGNPDWLIAFWDLVTRNATFRPPHPTSD